jgi:hypothetical protein
LTAEARRHAGRDPRRVLPVRRRSAYAGAAHLAANDNDAAPVLGRGGWLLTLAVLGLAAIVVAFT